MDLTFLKEESFVIADIFTKLNDLKEENSLQLLAYV